MLIPIVNDKTELVGPVEPASVDQRVHEGVWVASPLDCSADVLVAELADVAFRGILDH